MLFSYNWLDMSVFKTMFSTDMFHDECLLIWRETCPDLYFQNVLRNKK